MAQTSPPIPGLPVFDYQNPAPLLALTSKGDQIQLRTQAQIDANAVADVANLEATYILDVAPHTHYVSDGTALVAAGAGGGTGAAGKTVLNGTGAPGSGVGTNGDFYIDNFTHSIYGPKAAGAWPAGVSIVGPAGATGATGAAGATGATGAAGAAGATGATGAAGSAGATGATGPTGPTGPTGATGAAGTNGTNGTNGSAGAAGADGTTTLTINPQTSTYTLAASDANGPTLMLMNSGSALSLNIPPNGSVAIAIGRTILFAQKGVGQLSLVPGGGVTIRTSTSLTTRAQYSSGGITKVDTDEWYAFGDLS